MLKNNIITSFRSIRRKKFFTTITVLGLSFSMAYCLLTFLFVQHEWSFDKFHKNHEIIYRISELSADNSKAETSIFSPELKVILDWMVPEIKNSARFYAGAFLSDEWDQTHLRFKAGDRALDEKFLLTDSSFFDMFSFQLLNGHKNNLFQDKHSIVVCASAADKLFPNQNPIGQTIRVRSASSREWFWTDFHVTGVIHDMPNNSSIRTPFIMPYEAIDFLFEHWLERPPCDLYVQLAGPANIPDVELKIAEQIVKYKKEGYAKIVSQFPGMRTSPPKILPPKIHLQPLRTMHLSPHIGSRAYHGIRPASDPMYSFVLAGLCLALLFIAAINYIHITLGRAIVRLKDVGIRKVIGASRGNITQQIIVETLTIAAIALVLGILLAFLMLPVFNSMVDRSLTLSLFSMPVVFAGIAFLLATGLLAGIYPALQFSGFHPILSLKGGLRVGGKNSFSHILMGLQFSFSIFLITATLVMTAQLRHLQHSKTLGFDKEQILLIEGEQLNWLDKDIIMHKLNQIAGIEKISVAPEGLSNIAMNFIAVSEHRVNANMIRVDSNFVNVLGLKLLSGENFSQKYASPVLVTQSFVHQMNWENPIGQKVSTDDPFTFRKSQGYATVVGVVNDFRPNNLLENSRPIVLTNMPSIGTSLFLLKVNSADLSTTLTSIENTWQDVAPECLFRFSFLDDKVALWYSDATRWSRLIFYTAFATISIACLGIIGLLALALEARTKEIGIRKICGATVKSLFLLVTKRFSWLIGLAGLLTAPLSWFVLQKWLQHFSLHINLNIYFFILPIVIAIGFTLLSTSFQAWKAAAANPVEALRYE